MWYINLVSHSFMHFVHFKFDNIIFFNRRHNLDNQQYKRYMGDQVDPQQLNNRLEQIKFLKQIMMFWKKPAQGAQALTST